MVRKMTCTSALADWAATRSRDWSTTALDRAGSAVTDTVACMVAGVDEPAFVKVRDVIAGWSHGASSVVGQSAGAAPTMAALINGTAAHALDFDDNFDPAKAHASAVLVPAIFALAEDRDCSGADILDAYIVGLEIMARVGQGLNPYHRGRGWHATATVGAFGAAAGCARLLRLDPVRARAAIALSSSMAAGSMVQFGTMAKPFHAGLASQAGVMAAVLAECDFTAAEEVLEGPYGVQRLMVGPDVDALRDAAGDGFEHGQNLSFSTDFTRPLAIEAYGLKVKRFPNCGSNHRAMDGLLDLKDEHGFGPDDVARIDIDMPLSHANNLMYHDPATPAEARFSLEYACGLILVKGQVGLDDFEPDVIADPAIRACFRKVTITSHDMLESQCPTRVRVTLGSGKVLEKTVPYPVGHVSNPMTPRAMQDKLVMCASRTFGPARVKDLSDGFRHIGQETSARAIIGLMRPEDQARFNP